METVMRRVLLRVIAATGGLGLLISLLVIVLMQYSDSGPNLSSIRAMSLVAAFFLISTVISLSFLRKASIDPPAARTLEKP